MVAEPKKNQFKIPKLRKYAGSVPGFSVARFCPPVKHMILPNFLINRMKSRKLSMIWQLKMRKIAP